MAYVAHRRRSWRIIRQGSKRGATRWYQPVARWIIQGMPTEPTASDLVQVVRDAQAAARVEATRDGHTDAIAEAKAFRRLINEAVERMIAEEQG